MDGLGQFVVEADTASPADNYKLPYIYIFLSLNGISCTRSK